MSDFRSELNLERIRGHFQQGGELAVHLAVEHIGGVADDLAPIEEATLIRSRESTTEGLVGAVSYDTPYAVRQHEDLGLRHDQDRQAKYLEAAFASEVDAVQQILRRELRFQ